MMNQENFIKNTISVIKKYVPHLKMANDSSLLTWMKSQSNLYDILPGRMIKKLK